MCQQQKNGLMVPMGEIGEIFQDFFNLQKAFFQLLKIPSIEIKIELEKCVKLP